MILSTRPQAQKHDEVHRMPEELAGEQQEHSYPKPLSAEQGEEPGRKVPQMPTETDLGRDTFFF